MTVRERILMIRLVEKLKKHATYADTLGIEIAGAVKNQNVVLDPEGLTNV